METPLPSVAVVIPTLNEEAMLAGTLATVLSQAGSGVRVLVADGGSTDATVAIARQCGAQVVETLRRGRGCQIAEVVRRLSENVVLVLHADMTLPPRSIEYLRRWMATHPACPGGCLGHRFDRPRASYRLVEWWDCIRGRLGASYGDQGQFFRRDWLDKLGGFPDQPIMEDVELSRKLNAQGRPVYLDCPVLVSSRRLDRLGWWRSVVGNLRLRWAYRLGGPAISRKLHRQYYE